jgi:hypothetical protein
VGQPTPKRRSSKNGIFSSIRNMLWPKKSSYRLRSHKTPNRKCSSPDHSLQIRQNNECEDFIASTPQLQDVKTKMRKTVDAERPPESPKRTTLLGTLFSPVFTFFGNDCSEF